MKTVLVLIVMYVTADVCYVQHSSPSLYWRTCVCTYNFVQLLDLVVYLTAQASKISSYMN